MSSLRATTLLVGLVYLANAGASVSAQSNREASSDWLRTVTENLRQREYNFSEIDDAWTAPNRAQHLRVHANESGLRVEPRTTSPTDWSVSLLLQAIGRERALEPTRAFQTIAEGQRLELVHPSVVEWYVNNDAGLKQGFTLDHAPAGDPTRPVVLEMRLVGEATVRSGAARGGLAFVAAGREVLHYGALHVYDDRGKSLPSRIESASGTIRLVFDDTGAVYPVVVDPLMTSPGWSVNGLVTDRELGASVATAGDVNADGYSDVLVGVRKFGMGNGLEGAAFLYLGGPNGPSTTADWFAQSNNGSAFLGSSVGTAGDVNGDGYDDIVVGGFGYFDGEVQEGVAFLWLGGPGGLGPDGDPDNADWSFQSDQEFGWFGASVATAGDLNGDGRSEVVVGAPRYSAGQEEEGKVYVFLGVPGGLAVAPAWTAESNQACTLAPCTGPLFGASVGTAGDVNGDGFADLIVGAPQYSNGHQFEGAVYVWYGSANFANDPDGTPLNAHWSAESNAVLTNFGNSVGTAGDVDGDGYSDIVVGAETFFNGQLNEGRAFVWHGGAAGLGVVGSPVNADWDVESNQLDGMLGSAVATAGDVNGDGFADVIVGAVGYPSSSGGSAMVWYGGPGGLDASGGLAGAAWSDSDAQSGANFGASVATVGDVNGDGFSEVIVGASLRDSSPGVTENDGMASIYFGSADGPADTAAWSADSDQDLGQLGFAVASAGDVNGDGYDEILVGAPSFDGTDLSEGRAFLFLGSSGGVDFNPAWTAAGTSRAVQLGRAVDSAGDVNNDGYGDIVIGAPGLEKTLPEQGSAMVWYGGPGSLPDPSGLGADGTADNADWRVDGEGEEDQLGFAAASAGDVNADGFGDIIVGAPFHNAAGSARGKAYVYLGSASGPGSAVWSSTGVVDGDHFGWSVASAGDVNADRFGDVLVGAPDADLGETDEGRAFLYFGSGQPVPLLFIWSITSNLAFSRLGAAVGSAGDVDGDGFSDILLGEPGYTGSFAGEGRARIWRGATTGPVSPPFFTAVGDSAGAALGAAVASADLNLDGFSDPILGAPGYSNLEAGEGLVAAWYGGPGLSSITGTPSNADWTIESDQAGAELGASLDSAGDFNGDGFADVVVGAPGASFLEPGEGRAFLYYGNGRDGLHRIPRQARADGTAPIQPLGRSESNTSFRLRTLARSPAGRDRVGMMWEIKPLGTPFDGTGQVLSPLTLDTGVPDFFDGSAVAFDEPALGLGAGSFYRWRVRILTDSPHFPNSPWLTPARNALTETDLRTDGCVDADGDFWGATPDPVCAGGAGVDCDDGNPAVHPAHPEDCDALDNDCDGTVDDFATFCGLGECFNSGTCTTGVDSCVPGTPMPEICDRLDNDCNGVTPPDEIDADGDGFLACEECDDTEFGAIATPQPVTGLLVLELFPGFRLIWDSQDLTAGRGTVYDIFSGFLSDLGPTGDFSTGACLVDDIVGAERYDLTEPDPPSGEVRYYILRGQNGCPIPDGSYGDANRDSGAASSPSTCQ